MSTQSVELCETEYLYLKDFAYQTEATILRGTNAGLTFRHELRPNPHGGIYHFMITTQGDFELNVRDITFINNRISSSGQRELISTRHSAAIKTGLGQTNLLTVIARSSDLYLYINKQFVGYTKDSTSRGGTIGMFSSDVTGVDVAFRNVQIWIL